METLVKNALNESKKTEPVKPKDLTKEVASRDKQISTLRKEVAVLGNALRKRKEESRNHHVFLDLVFKELGREKFLEIKEKANLSILEKKRQDSELKKEEAVLAPTPSVV